MSDVDLICQENKQYKYILISGKLKNYGVSMTIPKKASYFENPYFVGGTK